MITMGAEEGGNFFGEGDEGWCSRSIGLAVSHC